MGSTFTSLQYHIVFSTKDRRPLLRPEWRAELFEYIGGTVRGLGGVLTTVNGPVDHVHLLTSLRPTHCISDFVRELKKGSALWACEREKGFHWQDGYSAFTVSPSQTDAVHAYIAKQEEHHKKLSFADELKATLEKAKIKFDPEYLL